MSTLCSVWSFRFGPYYIAYINIVISLPLLQVDTAVYGV